MAAETAELQLDQRASRIARDLGRIDEPDIGGRVSSDTLEPFDGVQLVWCRSVVGEADELSELTLATVKENAPNIHNQLQSDANDGDLSIEQFIGRTTGGLPGYVRELKRWCRSQIKIAELRPRVLKLAEQLRSKRLLLSAKQLEIIARYQTTLDNQLYKALRALREAQEWRRARSSTETSVCA